MFHLTKKRAVAMAVVGSLALSAGAYAYFTGAAGTGGGSASAGSSVPFGVAVSSNGTGTLTPGGGTQLLTYTVTNPSTGHQSLSSVEASVAASDTTPEASIMEGTTAVPGCKASWFTAVATPDSSVSPQDLGSLGTSTGTVLVRMLNVDEPQDLCQGRSPRITVKAS
jgi:hypothetical protein